MASRPKVFRTTPAEWPDETRALLRGGWQRESVDVHSALEVRQAVGGPLPTANYATLTVHDEGCGPGPTQIDEIFRVGYFSSRRTYASSESRPRSTLPRWVRGRSVRKRTSRGYL